MNDHRAIARGVVAPDADTLCWLYPYEHARNPILVQGIGTLEAGGRSAIILDRTSRRTGRTGSQTYRHVPLGRHPFRLLYPIFLIELLLRTVRSRPTLVLASSPDTALVAWVAAWWLSIPLVYYPYELFGEERPARTTLRERAWAKVERWLLSHRRTQAVITQNAERRHIYETERGASGKVVLIHNYKHWSPVPRPGALRKALKLPPATRIVLYEGALIDGRCLVQLITSVQWFPSDCLLVLLGEVSDYARSHLLPVIRKLRLEERVKLFGRVPHERLREHVVDADLGIITYANNCRNNYLCEPGKLSDYVLAGVPIIAPEFPTIISRVESFGIGECLDFHRPKSIAEGVVRVLAHPRDHWTAALAEAARTYIWETQSPVLLRTVDTLIQASAPARRSQPSNPRRAGRSRLPV